MQARKGFFFLSFGVTSARRGGAVADELKDRGAGDDPYTGRARGW